MLQRSILEYVETIFDPDGGDNLWNLQEVGADTYNHHVEVGLDGAPFFSGGDWGPVSKVGEVNGILRSTILQDHALKFGTNVYADALTNITLKGTRKVIPRVFVNGTKHSPTILSDGSFYFNFQLQPGWNEVHITEGSQTHNHVLEMEGMSGLSLVMDSNRCE